MRKLTAILLLVLLLGATSPVFCGMTETSGVTVQSLIDRVRRDIGGGILLSGVTDNMWTDSDFIQWANEASKIIINETRCLESGVSNIILIEHSRRYSLASGVSIADLEAVEHDSGNTKAVDQILTLDLVQKRDYGHGKAPGVGSRPSVYCLWNNYIEIWPIPHNDNKAGVTLSGTTLYVYPVLLPTEIDQSTDALQTPASLDPAVIHYMKAKAMYKDSKQAEGDKSLALFKAMVDQYIVNVQRRKPIE